MTPPPLRRLLASGLLLLSLWAAGRPLRAASAPRVLDLSRATVVVRPGDRPAAEATAARVLVEEVQRRTGLHWTVSTRWPRSGPVIALSGDGPVAGWPVDADLAAASAKAPRPPEGYRFRSSDAPGRPEVWILGNDARGALYGVGQLLRSLEWDRSVANLPAGLDIVTSPAFPIRGHQLGYRHTANSYDGWGDRKFEQYIRELALFGANSIEGIPFHDTRQSPHMPLPRAVMNRRLSEICQQYGLDYWIWSPADFDLKDVAKRQEHLDRHAALFRDCPRLDAVFFPGGDPGDNAPDVVVGFLEDLARLLNQHHPKARIWLSLQGFHKAQVEWVRGWVGRAQPDWLGGLVAGPSSPPLPEMRAWLPRRYGLRDYPDITHTVRCQFPVAAWDPAFHLTLGREAANPRPVFYRAVIDHTARHTVGSISYSDGIHDDVNKAVWSRLGWQADADVSGILQDYARCFFGARAARAAADGILALERNWDGPLASNGSVEATLALWERLERENPRLRDDWRWQLCLLRANYDALVRRRLAIETAQEGRANQALALASTLGADAAIDAAEDLLRQDLGDTSVRALRNRVVQLCADLFRTIRLQTSVPQHQASGYERGAVLDFVDRPLNNRWWMEDEFRRIRSLPSEPERVRALDRLRTWEAPGPGSHYDEVGHIGRSPHVVRGEGIQTDPLMERNPNPGYWWWDEGRSRRRLSWQTSMDWPLGLRYEDLDPQATYRVRLTGYGQPRLRANGTLLEPTRPGRIEVGEVLEYPVPAACLREGLLLLTFDALAEEAELNWRKQSRVSEVWLLREPAGR